jgi:alpha-mannosidase
MLRHPDYTRDRIRQLVDRLGGQIYARSLPVSDLVVAGPVDRIGYEQAQRLEGFRPVAVGEQFRPTWATFWFRGRTTLPAEWKGRRVDLLWDSQSEATLWVNGRVVQGLNMTQGDRPDAILLDAAAGGETVEFQIELACNRKFGAADGEGRAGAKQAISPYHLRRCDVAVFDPEAWSLYWDAYVLCKLEAELAKDDDITDKSWAGLLLYELNRFCNMIVIEDRATWPEAAAILKALYEHHNAGRSFNLSAIGHAHIDTAWLWPLAETHRKCERTFASQTAYMRDYPEYRFACSQAYQYQVIKQRNPDLYRRIVERVRSGQWIPVGGTWIEPDCNIPSGEALCRQFLLGQRFFEREFGRRCNEFWNPDVFGYNGQLPQIMRLSGVTRFLTQKLSWNRFNKPHHHTFTWRGIDGSEVITHFPPADTYNAMSPYGERNEITWLRQNVRDYRDHDRSHEGIMLYGFGDGGGGPTKPMLEILRRTTDLQGLPLTQPRTSDEFFERLERDATDLPVMWGELYFEYHRGTYTSQAMIKRHNRKGEGLLHDLEVLGAAATLVGRGAYPAAEMTALWEVLLLNQFHDILPGSSIGQVYRDAAAQFEDFFARGGKLLDTVIGGGDATPINTLGVCRREVAEHAGKLAVVEAPPLGPGRVVDAADQVDLTESGDRVTLANGQLCAVLDRTGRLVSLVERSTGRETLAAAGHVFETYDDRPTNYDAWDIDPFHMETRQPVAGADGWTVVRRDPLRAEVAFEMKIGRASTLRVTVRLDAHSPGWSSMRMSIGTSRRPCSRSHSQST